MQFPELRQKLGPEALTHCVQTSLSVKHAQLRLDLGRMAERPEEAV